MTAGGIVTAPLPAIEVERARNDLRQIVDTITTVQHRRVEFDDGQVKHFTAPPLLTQVEQEITEQSAKAGAFTPRSKPPLWIDAVQFLADVDAHTDTYEATTRATRVREWSAAMSSAASGYVVDASELVRHWQATISALLEPKPKMRLRGQRCPNCRAEKVWDRHDDAAGENHARPALEIDTEHGLCICRHCDEKWEPEYWEHLVQVLQQQRHEVLAETGYNTSVSPRSAGEAGLRWYDVGDDDLPTAAPSSRLRVHPDLVQCDQRVRVPNGDRTRRCPSLLNVEMQCPNQERHERPAVESTDE